MSTDFGLDDLASVLPGSDAKVKSKRVVEQADQRAEEMGFPSREVAVRRKRRVSGNDPTDQLNLRVSVHSINRFIEWCELERITYREGFQRLVEGLDEIDTP